MTHPRITRATDGVVVYPPALSLVFKLFCLVGLSIIFLKVSKSSSLCLLIIGNIYVVDIVLIIVKCLIFKGYNYV